jgi:hypothetical protein
MNDPPEGGRPSDGAFAGYFPESRLTSGTPKRLAHQSREMIHLSSHQRMMRRTNMQRPRDLQETQNTHEESGPLHGGPAAK